MEAMNSVEAIHQVLIVDGLGLPDHLPDVVVVNTECARALHPEAAYQLWTGDSLREYIRDNFDGEVLTAFDTLTPYSYKCDLARFCLLYASGGIYLDLAVRMMNRWAIPEGCGVAAFTEMYPGMMSWTATQTSLLWSRARRPEWEFAIRWIVENCRTRFYGPHDHYPTAGPLLGRAIAAAMAAKGQTNAADDQWIGECRYVTPERKLQNLCYVAPDKLLVGLRTKLIAGDLTEMGLAGTNNYCNIWRARKVYGETIHVWNADDPLLNVESRATRTATGIAVSAGTVGRVQYGPFVNLDAGQYRLRIDFREDTRFRKLFIDLSVRYGTAVVHEYDFDGGQIGVREFIEFDFNLHEPQIEVEFRVSVFGDFSGELKSFTLRPIDERVWTSNDDRIGIILGRRTPDGIAIPPGTTGRALYGPYAGVEPGCYCLRINFSADTVSRGFSSKSRRMVATRCCTPSITSIERWRSVRSCR